MDADALFMQRALELAEYGRGTVSPNPMVGCVIVNEGRVIGEGYHQRYGGDHAEVEAIKSVKRPDLLSQSTVYVTLEPCSHWGKTPPCANLLIEKGVKKVVIAAIDSNPLVGGKGVQLLESAGIEVVTGLLETQSRWQNRRFFTQMEKKRPYIILKWAKTFDGFLARKDYSSKWITNAQSRQLVHKWRAEEDSILIGKNTAKYDNPTLNVRDWTGNDPIRLLIDSRLELPDSLRVFDHSIPTICYNTLKSHIEPMLDYVKLSDTFSLEEILKDLSDRKIQSLIVEGGSYLLKKFIEAELWDEARVFTGKATFGEGITAPVLAESASETIQIQEDTLHIYYHV